MYRENIPVLIVEDDKDRQEILKNLFKKQAWILIHTAERAVRLVQAFRFELISLDFDLAGPGDGADAAQAIADSENRDACILIHSMNVNGAERIKQILPHAVWVPINQITQTNDRFKRLRKEIGRVPDIDWAYVFSGNR